MKAHLADGTTVDLGHGPIMLHGEPLDDSDLTIITGVKATVMNCILQAHYCWIEDQNKNNYIRWAKGQLTWQTT